MSKILITADWHIKKGDYIWPRRPEISGDVAYSISQITELIREHNIEHVIMAGDIFDKQLQYSDALYCLRAFLNDMERLANKIYFVQGQHEKAVPPFMRAISSETINLHNDCVTINDRLVRGLDYQHPLEVKQALQQLGDHNYDVLVTHQVWKDFLSEDFGDVWLHDIGGNPDIVISGDYHQLIVRANPAVTQVWVPGPIALTRINEDPNKYVIVADENWQEEVFRLRTRGVYGIAVSTEAGLQELIANADRERAFQRQEGVPDEIAMNIVELSVPSDLTDIDQLIQPLRAYAHIFLKRIFPQTTPISVADERRLQAVEGGVEGCLSEFYGQDESVYRDALQLWRSDQTAEMINTIFEKRAQNLNCEG